MERPNISLSLSLSLFCSMDFLLSDHSQLSFFPRKLLCCQPEANSCVRKVVLHSLNFIVCACLLEKINLISHHITFNNRITIIIHLSSQIKHETVFKTGKSKNEKKGYKPSHVPFPKFGTLKLIAEKKRKLLSFVCV